MPDVYKIIETAEAHAREQGRHEERAAIVAMYRERAAWFRDRIQYASTVGAQFDARTKADHWDREADFIERGDHLATTERSKETS